MSDLKSRLELLFPKYVAQTLDTSNEILEQLISFFFDERIARYQIKTLSEEADGKNKQESDEILEIFVFRHSFVEPYRGSDRIKNPKAFVNGTTSAKDEEETIYPLYMPKFNTFFKHPNENLHIEKGDEGFECFSLQESDLMHRVGHNQTSETIERNVARSRSMISTLRLRIQEDVKPFMQQMLNGSLKPFLNEHAIKSNLKEATFGYIQSEEQVNDFYRQLCGENEHLTLTMDTAIHELRRCLNRRKHKQVKKNYNPPIFNFEFKNAYLRYLQLVDYVIVTHKRASNSTLIDLPSRIRSASYPEQVSICGQSLTTPISFESIGHLSKFYFIPWLDYSIETRYTMKIDTNSLLFPWLLFNSKLISDDISPLDLIPNKILLAIKKSHHSMYHKEHVLHNRLYGIIALNEEKFMNQLYVNYSSLLMREYSEREVQFYEKEKRKLLPEKGDTDAEDLIDLLQVYKKRLENRAKLSQFISRLQSLRKQ